jgi:hypothetical protein
VRLYRLTIKAPPYNLPPRYNICPTDPVDAAVGTRTVVVAEAPQGIEGGQIQRAC